MQRFIHTVCYFEKGWLLIREVPEHYYGTPIFVAPIGEDGELVEGDYFYETVDTGSDDGKVQRHRLERCSGGLKNGNVLFSLDDEAHAYVGKFKHPDFEHTLALLDFPTNMLEDMYPEVIIGLDPFGEGNYESPSPGNVSPRPQG